MTYEESLAYLQDLEIFGVRLGLGRIERLLALLGNPENKYRVIHITGTNGKGSVASMLAAALKSSGRQVGLFTSPHLVSYTERVQVDGLAITSADFASGMTVIRKAIGEMTAAGEECPTQFEALTALAFYHFSRIPVEYAVIEVGLGGLLDSTNVVSPCLTIITNVTLEHAAYCGGTLSGVARHKAGIIKPSVPVITAATGEPLAVIRETAMIKKAKLYVYGDDFAAKSLGVHEGRQEMLFSRGGEEHRYELGLLGCYQTVNSALAMMALALVGEIDPQVTPKASAALKRVKWPGRFEVLKRNGDTIILDGAHNPAGVKALRESLDAYFPQGERVFLLGILSDKDMAAMALTLVRDGDTVITTEPPSPRAKDAAELAAFIRGHKTGFVQAISDVEEAFAKAHQLSPGRLLIICGSLYLVGWYREHHQQVNAEG